MKFFVAIALCLGVAAAVPLMVINEDDLTHYTDCHAVWKAGHRTNGTYRLTLNGKHHEAPCVFHKDYTLTIFLRRDDGVVSFNRNYSTYRAGFGDPLHGYFTGLDKLHFLTSQSKAVGLDIRFMDWNNNDYYYFYEFFKVGNQASGYRLTLSGRRWYSPNLQDDMQTSNGQQFYTFDRPDTNNCATSLGGGWWYKYEPSTNICARAYPTGIWYNSYHCCPSTNSDGIIWASYSKHWKGHYSLKKFVMSVKHYL